MYDVDIFDTYLGINEANIRAIFKHLKYFGRQQSHLFQAHSEVQKCTQSKLLISGLNEMIRIATSFSNRSRSAH